MTPTNTDYNNIPQEMKALPQWVGYFRKPKLKKDGTPDYHSDGTPRMDKIPVNPRTLYGASSANAQDWTDFNTALASVGKSATVGGKMGIIEGIGFMFSPLEGQETICGIDIDHVIDNKTGELHPAAAELITDFNSYTELSPSECGLHIFYKGSNHSEWKNKFEGIFGSGTGLEMYQTKRFFTVTGKAYGEQRQIISADNTAEKYYNRFAVSVKEHKEKTPDSPIIILTDDQVIEKATFCNGEKFLALMRGDTSSYGEDESRADLALCGILAFWCNGDAVQIDRIFRRSGLMRDKWDGKRGNTTYGNITIQKAITNCSNFYDPSFSKEKSAEDMQSLLTMRMLANARKNGFVLDGEGLPDYLQFNKRQKCYSVSVPLLAEYIRQHENFITVHDRNGRENKIFWYAHGVYSPVNDSIIQAYIKRYVEVFDITLIKMSQIREVLQDIRASHDFVDRSKLNADEDIINFQNGLYHLESGELTEHDPSVLSKIQLPCEYAPNAKQHSKFDSYIWRLTGGDTELMELICQFMGIAITNVDGSRFKKAMILFGAGDTGKSQILKLTQRLLGNDNYSSGGLSDLENERFGSSALYNKRLFGDADMSYASVREMKIFKQATGRDNIRGEFKNENSFSFQYRGLLWFCANALPNFGGDRGSWVYERIIPIKCDNVIPRAEQDARLLDKMFEERAAIIADVLIPAAKRAINNGYRFTVPAVCADLLEKYKKENPPAVSFYYERCEMRKADDPCKDRFTCAEVYTRFVGGIR